MHVSLLISSTVYFSDFSGSQVASCLEVATSWSAWSDWNPLGYELPQGHQEGGRGVEFSHLYVYQGGGGADEDDSPGLSHHPLVVRFLKVSLPNRSTVMDSKAGAGPIQWGGREVIS